MCTRHFGMCVHSSDGEREKNEIYLFFLSLFLSPSLVPTEQREKSLKFSLIDVHTALLPIDVHSAV